MRRGARWSKQAAAVTARAASMHWKRRQRLNTGAPHPSTHETRTLPVDTRERQTVPTSQRVTGRHGLRTPSVWRCGIWLVDSRHGIESASFKNLMSCHPSPSAAGEAHQGHLYPSHLAEAHGDDVEREEVPVHALAARRVAARVLVTIRSLLQRLRHVPGSPFVNIARLTLLSLVENNTTRAVRGAADYDGVGTRARGMLTAILASRVALGSVKSCTNSFDSFETCGNSPSAQHAGASGRASPHRADGLGAPLVEEPRRGALVRQVQVPLRTREVSTPPRSRADTTRMLCMVVHSIASRVISHVSLRTCSR
jgi:hypothetical protein